jgi:hypothetical protein
LELALVNIGITFSFQFGDDGYGLKVVKGTYDAVTQKSDEINAEIPPPVTVAAVQKQVTEFLETRKACIKRMEEEAQRLQREW